MAVSPENATRLKTEIRDRAKFGPFSLWVNDACSHEMYALDIDKVTFKLRTRIMRLWESKMPGELLAPSELATLPILARLIQFGVTARVLAPGSGVFVVRGSPPYVDGAEVTSIPSGRVVRVDASRLIAMFDCEA